MICDDNKDSKESYIEGIIIMIIILFVVQIIFGLIQLFLVIAYLISK